MAVVLLGAAAATAVESHGRTGVHAALRLGQHFGGGVGLPHRNGHRLHQLSLLRKLLLLLLSRDPAAASHCCLGAHGASGPRWKTFSRNSK